MEPIRNESHEIVGDRNKNGELVGWTAFAQTRKKDGTLVSFQENEGLLYKELD